MNTSLHWYDTSIIRFYTTSNAETLSKWCHLMFSQKVTSVRGEAVSIPAAICRRPVHSDVCHHETPMCCSRDGMTLSVAYTIHRNRVDIHCWRLWCIYVCCKHNIPLTQHDVDMLYDCPKLCDYHFKNLRYLYQIICDDIVCILPSSHPCITWTRLWSTWQELTHNFVACCDVLNITLVFF